jgi:hypothetical protein
MDKETKKAIREQQAFDEDAYESSDESIKDDFELWEHKRQSGGDFIPDDLFKYKYLRLVPKTQDKYEYLIDKDAVLSNVSGQKPNIDELSFTNQTIVLIQQVFRVDKQFYQADEEGNVLIENGQPKVVVKKVFDDSFIPIIEGLNSYKSSQQVLSRAIGDDREAILDRTQTLQKGITKKGEKKKNVLGFGE